MKKITLLISLLFIVSCFSFLWAQTTSATWPLTSSTQRNASVTDGITAASQVSGPGFASPTYNNRALSTGGSVSTQNSVVNPGGVGTNTTTAHANGAYVEFAVTPLEGYEFNVSTVSFNMGAGNANSNGTSVEYSLNKDFSSPVVLGGPSGTTSFPARDVLYPFSFSAAGLTVPSGKTLYLRIYAWNGSTSGRLLLLNNLVIEGTTNTSRPSVTTTAISDLTATSVTAGGNVTSDAGNAVTERGIVYGTSANPTIANTKVVAASGGTGSFTVPLSGLEEFTTYYVRAYATNSAGTAYGANVSFFTPPLPDAVVTTPKQMEKLDRGVVALRSGENEVYVGWRLFGTDPSDISFNVYRNGLKLNKAPITGSTNYVDATTENGSYAIKPVINGVEQRSTKPVAIWAENYLNIPLQKPAGGTTPDGVAYTYTANDASVGDVDGDGEYEVILKWDPTNSKDNSQAGYTGNVYLDAYKFNGTRLWRIDLGKNIRAGAHYTQFIVYDLDGDGKAEVACKTANGTVDGRGVVIGDATADHRNSSGYILSGPEYLTVFNGETGAAMATTDYLPGRGNVGAWGDTYGNRVDRFIAAVAYLDGSRPSLVMGRGYYTRLVRAAWDWRDGKLTLRWIFDSDNGNPGNNLFRGDGNHQMTIGDMDGDGKDEVNNGSSTINDNGRGLWSNNMGHGDALHMSDLDPDRPGLEIWQPYEDPEGNGGVGAAMIDAKTGNRIFVVPIASEDIGRALAADIDPRHKGYEMWASRGDLYTAKGVSLGTRRPSINFAAWWDGDLSRELLDGTTIRKWNFESGTTTTLLSPADVSSNNSTKATPALSGDIMGDWREEVVFRTSDNNNLRIYTTTIPTEHRIYTLMHDPQYRAAIAWQNSAYNQPPHPGFYLGTDMDALQTPNIEYVKDIIPPVALAKNVSFELKEGKVVIQPEDVDNGSHDAFDVSLELSKNTFDCSDLGENEVVLTVTDESGNKATATATVTVLGSLPEKPSIEVTRTDLTPTGVDSKTVFLGYGAQQVTLAATSSGETGKNTYLWSSAAGLNASDISAPVFTATTAGQFTYTVTVTNEYGCTVVSDPVTITVIDVRCGTYNDKVMVCHKGKAICIDAISVQDHLSHGCTIGSCTNTEDGKSSVLTDIATEAEVTNSLKVYPNPLNAQAKIGVTLAKAERYAVELFDMKGVLIKTVAKGEGNLTTASHELNAVNLPKGVYLIKLVTETEVLTDRVVVQ